MNSNIDFEKLKETIIPYFIQIYGEEYESIIVNRINSIIPIFYDTLNSQENVMYSKQRDKKLELTLKFLELNNISLSKENRLDVIQNNNSAIFSEIPEADKLLNFYFDGNTYTKYSLYDVEKLIFEPTDKKPSYMITKSINLLKTIGISITPENYNDWLLTNEAKELAKKIKPVKAVITQLDEEYDKFDSQFDQLRETIDKGKKVKKSAEEKYMIEFLKSIEVYMTNQDKEMFHNYLNSSNKNFFILKSQLQILKIIGQDFHCAGLIESFGLDCNQKLISESTSDYMKKTIISNRIKYYELLGIYDAKIPPSEFLETDLAKKNLPKQSFIDEIISKKDEFQRKFDDEIIVLLSNYNECMEKLNALNLLDNSPITDCLDIIKEKTMCINPSVKKENNELAPILFFSPDLCLKGYSDVMFIHEINHAIETTLLECTNDSIRYKTGFEELDADFKDRKFEKFSENINQLIAMLVTETMHNDGVYLFDEPITSKIKNGTSYERYNNFTFDFFEKFKKEIISSRVNNNLSPILDLVGYDNFEKLNDIINKYASLPYYEMMNAILGKKETIYTKERENLLYASSDVINSMILYANNIKFDEMSSNHIK